MPTDKEKNGRSERIRTSGPCLPKTVLYQAELHSVTNGLADTRNAWKWQVAAANFAAVGRFANHSSLRASSTSMTGMPPLTG